MRTPASIAGHPIHAMLIVFPVGLWVFALVSDLIVISTATPEIWYTVSFLAIIGGLIGAIAAAVPGLIDLVWLRKAPVRKLAFAHMGINLAIVALFAINAWIRRNGVDSMALPLALSVAGVALLVISGWLGGEMVHIHRVAVDEPEAAPVRPAPWREPIAPRPERVAPRMPEHVS